MQMNIGNEIPHAGAALHAPLYGPGWHPLISLDVDML